MNLWSGTPGRRVQGVGGANGRFLFAEIEIGWLDRQFVYRQFQDSFYA